MASPNLPESITPEVTVGHSDDHEVFHPFLNLFDFDAIDAMADGQVLKKSAGLITAGSDLTSAPGGTDINAGVQYVNPADGNDTSSGLSERAPVKTIHEAASRNPGTIVLNEGTYNFSGLGEIRFTNPINIVGRYPNRHHQNTTGGVFITNSGATLASYFRWEKTTNVNIYGSVIRDVGFSAAGVSQAAVRWYGVNFAEMSGCRIYDQTAVGRNVYLLEGHVSDLVNGGDCSWNKFINNYAQRALLLKAWSANGRTLNRWNIGMNTFVWTHSATADLTKPAVHIEGRPGGHFIWGNSCEGVPTTEPEDQSAPFMLLTGNNCDHSHIIGNAGEANTGPGSSYLDIDAGSQHNIVLFSRADFTHQGTVRENINGVWTEVPEPTVPSSGFANYSPQISPGKNIYIVTPSGA